MPHLENKIPKSLEDSFLLALNNLALYESIALINPNNEAYIKLESIRALKNDIYNIRDRLKDELILRGDLDA